MSTVGGPKPRARKSDPATSHSAAVFVAPRAGTDRWKALAALSRAPMTDFELAAAVGSTQTSIGKRRGELVFIGFAEAVEGVTRPAPSGAAAKVWTATAKGRKYFTKNR